MPNNNEELSSFPISSAATSNIPLDRIVDANLSLGRYGFYLEMIPGLKLFAALDFEEERQFIRLGLTGKPFPLVEIYWEGTASFAYLTRSDGWVRVRGKPFEDEIRRLCELLRAEPDTPACEEGEMWVLEFHLERLSLCDHMKAFFESVLGESRSEHLNRVMELSVKHSRTLQGVQRVRVSRESHLIHGFDIETWWEGGRHAARSCLWKNRSPFSLSMFAGFLCRRSHRGCWSSIWTISGAGAAKRHTVPGPSVCWT